MARAFNGTAVVSHRTIADELALSQPTVRKIIATLENLELVAVDRSKPGDRHVYTMADMDLDCTPGIVDEARKPVARGAQPDCAGVRKPFAQGAQASCAHIIDSPNRPSLNKHTQEGGVCVGFEEFWNAYPRPAKRESTLAEWTKLAPSPELQATILAAIATQAKSHQWQRRGVIPHPDNWLRERRWEDEGEGERKITPEQLMEKRRREREERRRAEQVVETAGGNPIKPVPSDAAS
jgi:hypothetical protein